MDDMMDRPWESVKREDHVDRVGEKLELHLAHAVRMIFRPDQSHGSTTLTTRVDSCGRRSRRIWAAGDGLHRHDVPGAGQDYVRIATAVVVPRPLPDTGTACGDQQPRPC